VILALAMIVPAVGARSKAAPVVKAAHSTRLHRTILVDAKGRTLYVLTPETAHRLLCKSAACLSFWPPLTVRSARARLVAGRGVSGRLGLLHRRHGPIQVTFRGLPVYRFKLDRHAGDVNGDRLMTFGGTWHVVAAASRRAPAPKMPAPKMPAPSPMPGY